MNYDKIIVEMMSRIQELEERVGALEGDKETANPKITTAEIREFILAKINNAGAAGEESITIRANEIHREMKLKSRFPMVCNAMRQCMAENDKVVYETASGYSSSLEIKYFCGGNRHVY